MCGLIGICVFDDGLGLAHRHLDILDLSEHGSQPMVFSDGRYHVVFNGETYNHPKLRDWCVPMRVC
jgi:asparagine synthase (glutamine-hydrolysing)